VTDVPHFDLPLRFDPGQSRMAEVEQESVEEILACVLAVMLCERGFRVDVPEFGIDDPTFDPVVDTDLLRSQIELWEPRAQLALGQRRDELDQLIARVQMRLQVRTEG